MATPPACSEVKLIKFKLIHREASRSLFWNPPRSAPLRSQDWSPRTLAEECSLGPPPLRFESSAKCEDRCFHALPSLEASEPNTGKPRSVSQERFAPLLTRECQKLCVRLIPPTGHSRIILQVYHHSLPPPRPWSPRPSSYRRFPKANLMLPHVGSGPAPSCWTSMKIGSSRPGLSPYQGLPAGTPSDCRESKFNNAHGVPLPSRSPHRCIWSRAQLAQKE